MRKNKLYTANRWNASALMQDKNILELGGGGTYSNTVGTTGSATNGWLGNPLLNPNNSNPFGVSLNTPTSVPYIDWSSPTQRSKALGYTKALENDFSNRMKSYRDSSSLNMSSAVAPITPALFESAKGLKGAAFGKEIFKGLGNAALGVGASLAGQGLKSAIRGKLRSGVGDVFSNVGSAVGSGLMLANPLLGAGVIFGSELLGGGIDALFGSHINEANVAGLKQSNAELNQAANNLATARTNEDLLQKWGDIDMGFDFNQDYVGEDGVFASEAEDLYNKLKGQQGRGRARATHGLMLASNNMANRRADQVAGSFITGFGGPLNSKDNFVPANYSSHLTVRSNQNMEDKKLGLLQAPVSGNNFDLGGVIQTHGSDFSNGLMFINNGGTHEENPLEGVPMGFDPEGTPNLVEEGETIWNDYVFSNRLKVPKTALKELGLGGNLSADISFADASKKLGKESEQRPNDPISIAGLEASMSRLAEIQEAERMKNHMKEYIGLEEYACGGKLNKYAGPGSKSQKIKRGNTGLNTYKFDPIDQFKYWNREANDYDEGYRDFIENKLNEDWIARAMSGQYGDMSRYKGANNVNPTVEQAWQLGLDKMNSDWHKAMARAYDEYIAGIDPKTGIASASNADLPDETWEYEPYSEGWEERRGISTEQVDTGAAQEGSERRASRGNPKTYYAGLRYAPAIGAGIMSLTDAFGLTNNPDYTMADKLEAAAIRAGYAPSISFNPNGDYLKYVPMDIWFEQNRLDANSRATDRAIMNSTSPSRMAGLLASGYNSQIASGNLYRNALEYNDKKRQDVADFNRKTNMFNSQMGLEAAMANARYRQMAQQLGLNGLAQAVALRDDIDKRVGAARAANLTNLFNSLGDIGRENFAMNQLNTDKSRRYTTSASGKSGYKTSESSAYGGKIKRRKK